MVGYCFKMSEKFPYWWLQFMLPGVSRWCFFPHGLASIACPFFFWCLLFCCWWNLSVVFFFLPCWLRILPFFLGFMVYWLVPQGTHKDRRGLAVFQRWDPSPVTTPGWSRHGYCRLKDCFLVIVPFCSVCTFSSSHLKSYFRGTFLHFEKHLEVHDCWKVGPCLRVSEFLPLLSPMSFSVPAYV